MIQHICCPMAKSYMLTKPQVLWYKFCLLNWDFFLPEISLSSGKISALACFGRDGSLWEYFSLHAFEDLQPNIYSWAHPLFSFLNGTMAWRNLLCILSSLEPLPWEQLKRLKPEKFPVCRALIRFQCRGRDPQTISASRHLISLAFVNKHHFVFSGRREG